jgi:hypothetical protein
VLFIAEELSECVEVVTILKHELRLLFLGHDLDGTGHVEV